MRVLHVLAETGWSGGEEQLRIVVEHLAREGHENALLLEPGARFADVGTRLSLATATAPLRAPWRPRAWTAPRAFVREQAPHVLHFGCGRSLLWAGLATLGLRVPLRITTRRIDYPIGRVPWRAFRYRRLVDHVVANCAAVRRRVLAAGVPEGRVTVVHEGIELAPWQGLRAGRDAARVRLGLAAEALVLCCPATLRPRKGQRVLVRAFWRVAARFPHALLILAGAGTDRAALLSLVAELGLEARVRLPGAIRPVADLYAASDLFCLASAHEGLANACLEASAAGLPCVVSTAGGLPEIVADGETGAVVPIGDEAALAEALGRYLADGGLRARAGAAGAERTARMFGAPRMAVEMERLFARLSGT